MTRSRGFTTIELMVALLIASVVIALVWDFTIGERRRFEADQDRLAGIQGALRFDEYLASDLERLIVDIPGGQALTYEKPVDVSPDGRSISMFIAGTDDPAQAQPRPVQVTYRFDPTAGHVVRIAGTQETNFPGLLAEDVVFQRFPSPVVWPAGLAPLTRETANIEIIRYTVICIPESQRNLTPDQRAPQRRITLVGSMALRQCSERLHNEYWRILTTEKLQAP